MEALEPFDYSGTCWWCNRPANSAEHKYKKSDVISEFGRAPYLGASSLVRCFGTEVVAERIQGPNSQHLKFAAGLCHACNTTRSQTFDKAYEAFARFVRLNEEAIVGQGTLDLAAMFRSDWKTGLVSLRRFLVKHACCRIAESGRRIGEELVGFLDAARDDAPFHVTAEIRQDILERLGYGGDRLGSLWIGDLLAWHERIGLQCRRVESHYGFGWFRFSWLYDTRDRPWPDNMRSRVVLLQRRRNIDPGMELNGAG